MPDGDASLLLADASAIDRLRAEAGLGPSFFEVFASTSVLHTVGGGDAGGFDRLLGSRSLVACDRRLLDPVDSEGPDAELLNRYRTNFIAKLARRRVIILAVLEEVASGVIAGLEACRRDVGLLAGTGAPGYCEIVLVATGDLPASLQAAIEELRRCPAVGRVYLMTKWLQRGRDERHLALADHVWPLCVGRLLVVRATTDSLTGPGTPAPIMAWRTFAWGTLTRSSELPAWEADYLHALREALLPLEDNPPAIPQFQSMGPDGDVLATVPAEVRAFQWRSSAADIKAAGCEATDSARLREPTRKTCENVAKAAASRPGVNTLRQRIQDAWGRVASDEGIRALRWLRDGRFWRPQPVPELSQEQKSRLSRWHSDWQSLEQCRVNHSDGVDALVLARSRHLPLTWRFCIGMMILPLVFQFITGVLLPLRPEGVSDGSSLFTPARDPAASIAYLVDRSSSMDGIRLGKMKADLKAALEKLPDGARFTIVAFNEGLEELPIAKRGLIDANAVSRTEAIDWVDDIRASGMTTAVPGLRTLVALKPDLLVFLTDGLLSDGERSEINDVLVDEDFLGDTRVDTIMLYPSGEEPALQKLAEATGGRFRRISFDPFAPLGFNRVLAIAFCATAAGVLLGTLLPWFLERRAGVAATAVLQGRLQKLQRDFGDFSASTAVVLQGADALGASRRGNRAWDYQRALAARAFSQLEASLRHWGQPQATGAIGGAEISERDPLHAEDVQDFHHILDQSLPHFQTGEYQHGFFLAMAARHAAEIKALWKSLAGDSDLFSRGYLPTHAIAERFRESIGKFLLETSRQLLLPHSHGTDVGKSEREPYYALFRNLAQRIVDDPHRPFLSARVTAIGGEMPSRCLAWIGTKQKNGTWNLDKVARDFFRQRTQTRFVSETATEDIGLLALGLIHDEFEVTPRERQDGTLEFVVGDAP